jgi:argininosuccinate lyase
MKLWNKESTLTSQRIEEFTVGRDREFDILLAAYDVQGSMAHTRMLEQVGLLSREDLDLIEKELAHILEEIREGKFVIEKDVEDVHSQVELLLTPVKARPAPSPPHPGRRKRPRDARG